MPSAHILKGKPLQLKMYILLKIVATINKQMLIIPQLKII